MQLLSVFGLYAPQARGALSMQQVSTSAGLAHQASCSASRRTSVERPPLSGTAGHSPCSASCSSSRRSWATVASMPSAWMRWQMAGRHFAVPFGVPTTFMQNTSTFLVPAVIVPDPHAERSRRSSRSGCRWWGRSCRCCRPHASLVQFFSQGIKGTGVLLELRLAVRAGTLVGHKLPSLLA